MPLPKPPAKRAALLGAADFETQATPRPGARPAKSRTAAEPV
jgi:PhoH-like ATPase